MLDANDSPERWVVWLSPVSEDTEKSSEKWPLTGEGMELDHPAVSDMLRTPRKVQKLRESKLGNSQARCFDCEVGIITSNFQVKKLRYRDVK